MDIVRDLFRIPELNGQAVLNGRGVLNGQAVLNGRNCAEK